MKSKYALKLIVSGCLLSGICSSASAAAVADEYFDVNGNVAGFGSPSGTAFYDLLGAAFPASTMLTVGFGNAAAVNQVTVANAAGIAVGEVVAGVGVPGGVTVTGVAGHVIAVSPFVSTAASAGVYNFGIPVNWSAAALGNVATTPFTSGDPMLFGALPGDNTLAGAFSIILDGGPGLVLNTVNVNSLGLNVTLSGNTGVHPAAPCALYANTGSVLNMNDTSQAPGGFNFNNEPVGLAGGGTINFLTPIGNNSGNAAWLQTMAGAMNFGVVNFDWNNAGPSTFGGSYELQAGTLNFESAMSFVTAFSDFQPGSLFTIDAGTTIDNTSGGGGTMVMGGGSYSITGSFTFTGTGSMDFGPANVALTATPTITVNGSALNIGGVISGPAGVGLIKAGPGALGLNNAETYSGKTAINGGMLILGIGGSIANSSNILIGSGATFAIATATAGYALGAGQTLTGKGATGTIVCSNLDLTAGSPLVLTNNGSAATLTVGSGTLSLSNNPVTVAVTGSALMPGTYTLISAGGGSVIGTVASSTLTVTGAGLVSPATASLQISGGALQLLVLSPPPNLAIALAAPDSVIVSWPGPNDYPLQQNSNLSTGSWATSTNTISTTNGTNSITITSPTGTLFFRLSTP